MLFRYIFVLSLPLPPSLTGLSCCFGGPVDLLDISAVALLNPWPFSPVVPAKWPKASLNMSAILKPMTVVCAIVTLLSGLMDEIFTSKFYIFSHPSAFFSIYHFTSTSCQLLFQVCRPTQFYEAQ